MQYNIYLLLLYTTNCLATADKSDNLMRLGQEVLLCRECGADVADSYYTFNKISPGALKIDQKDLFGRHNTTIQTIINPFGVKFEVFTLEKARCANVGPRHGAHSWFPGYNWRLCMCPHCESHLGWTFESSFTSTSVNVDNNDVATFHGLILKNVLGENFTDSLIMLPKLYEI